ncbi:MAG: Fic family protein [bacterium]|nr:Fic family protein [bacterium]
MLDFLQGLDEDIRKALVTGLRNLWTHDSTAIEGNSLTLGETAFVLEEGLTVSGKPLKDHQEVVGHARAIDRIYDMVQRETAITEQDLFDLHKAVQVEAILDINKPVGKWKAEPNGTYIIRDGKQFFYDYAAPADVPVLMERWLNSLNMNSGTKRTRDEVISAYANLHISFVHVHPFFDGNGRIARLVSNIPVLRSGFPPIVIPREKRLEYITCLSEYELALGSPGADAELPVQNNYLDNFRFFCEEAWKESLDLVDDAHKNQEKREK